MTAQNQLNPRDTATHRQRATLYTDLRKGPVSTLHAREVLGIMSPAARVLELRRQGHRIVTHWVRGVDVAGMPHRSAVYVLMGDEV